MASNDFILSALLECGTLDIDFIDNLENDFGEWDGWDDLRERIIDEQITANDIIYEIFYNAVSEACNELEIDIEHVEIDIFTNCLDSHLHIKDENGYSEKIYDKKQLNEFIYKNYFDWKKEAIDYIQNRSYEDIETISDWVNEQWDTTNTDAGNLMEFEKRMNKNSEK